MNQVHRDLLVELGTEELPPKGLRRLMESFASQIIAGLDQAELSHAEHRCFATPRRLAVLVRCVALQQPARPIERKGPAWSVAYDTAGQPTQAALGFARSCGVEIEQLCRLETAKGVWLGYRGTSPGRTTAELLPGIVAQALTLLPIAKRMRWGESPAEFVRPVHWLVLMLGEKVVPATLLDTASGNTTRGHRIHHPQPISLREPLEYDDRLREEGCVIADFEARRERILAQVTQCAEALGAQALWDDALLDEVTALVEWPVALAGAFDEAFLRVPPEALISSMQGHQKYFPLRSKTDAGLLARFITVANLKSQDPAQVIAGNERVIRPRLADAAFFWDQDRRRSLAERIPQLKNVLFQKQLGSLFDKSARIAALGRNFAADFGVMAEQIERAAWLSKTDLLTEMVGEFPELQGVMGRYYAAHDGEDESIALAIDEGYRPRFAGDPIASSPLGQLLAVTERADTLIGIFALGKAPTGAKDPFALRRAALGLLRTCIEGQRSLDLEALLRLAAELMPAEVHAVRQIQPVLQFCLERLRGLYLERNYPGELFEAVRTLTQQKRMIVDPWDFHRRVMACAEFVQLPEAARLAASNKRIHNILRHADAGAQPFPPLDPDHLEHPEERRLYEAVNALATEIENRVNTGEYTAALRRLAILREPIDRFFDTVLVMTDEPRIRANRLALLACVSQLFLSVADVGWLPTGE
ncbi:MAG: glycine--tRNA ligase subunit beta [Nitrococcus mobilis]|nr:glycine--tRNA ligase subunit beta [Nitrococcus mobilis]